MQTNKQIAFALLLMTTAAMVTASGLVNLAAAKLALYHATGIVAPW